MSPISASFSATVSNASVVAGSRKKSEKKLVDMMDTGVTVLFVSHNLDQVKRICNKAMILEHGEMKAFGDIDEIAPVYEEMIE